MSIHAAYVINALRVGGAEKLVVTFAQALQKRQDRLTIITLRENQPAVQAEAEAYGAQVVQFPDRKVLAPGRLWRVTRYLREQNFDVVHTHLSMANIVGGIAGRLAGTPVCTTLHNTSMTTENHPLYRPLESFLLRRVAAQVIAVGWETAEAHQTRMGGKQISVIPNAVAPNPGLRPAERSALRAELSGDASLPLLVSVSRLEPQKGIFDLLEAFAILSTEHPQARLAIAGQGSQHSELQNTIAELGLDQRVRLLGLREDVPQILAAADLYVSASHWEGLPVAILEAMAAGLPLVATAVGDVPRVILEGTGRLVPPHQPATLAQVLAQMLSDPERMRSIGACARVHIETHYSSDAWAARLVNLYAGLNGRAREAGKGGLG